MNNYKNIMKLQILLKKRNGINGNHGKMGTVTSPNCPIFHNIKNQYFNIIYV